MTSAAMRSSMSLPRRCATSRTRSFSRRPLGPSVPLSWPPWPGSMTTRLILRPRERMREFCPELVWRAALAISSGAVGAVTGGLAADGLAAGGVAGDVVPADVVAADGVAVDAVAVDGAAVDGSAAGGVGLGVAGTSEAAGLRVDGGGWMTIAGAEASGAGEAAVDVSVGAKMRVEVPVEREA